MGHWRVHNLLAQYCPLFDCVCSQYIIGCCRKCCTHIFKCWGLSILSSTWIIIIQPYYTYLQVYAAVKKFFARFCGKTQSSTAAFDVAPKAQAENFNKQQPYTVKKRLQRFWKELHFSHTKQYIFRMIFLNDILRICTGLIGYFIAYWNPYLIVVFCVPICTGYIFSASNYAILLTACSASEHTV